MSFSRPAQRRLLLVLVAAAAVSIALGARAIDALQPLELDSVDARFAIRGTEEPPRDVVLVAFDTASLGELGLRPPIVPRRVHARLIDTIRRGAPAVIAYDFQFIGFGNPSQRADLLAAIERAAPIVLATHDVTGPPLDVPAGLTDPSRVGAVLGTVGVLADADGKLRRAAYRGPQWKSFAVVAAEVALGRSVETGGFPAPIDYRGPPGTFTTYPIARVLAGDLDPAAFRDRMVVVGATDPVFKDAFQTPMSNAPMSGAEVHANAIATILAGLPLTAVPNLVDVAIILMMGLAAPLATLRLSAVRVLALGAALLVLFAVAAQLAFNAGEIIEVTYPLLALALALAGSVAVDYVTEIRERMRLRRAFSRFVPDEVIEDVMGRTDEDFRLGGTTMEATVLFCDLRGFSAFAEHQDAVTVIDMLNRYLGEMSEAILSHGGTVVTYLGDGVMAVFGAPVEQDDHAARALAAAREMLATRLPAFNAALQAGGLETQFRIGIGVASGHVRSGNVGSHRRLEYAAVGDTTNVAARLQAKSKETGHPLMIAEATRDLAGPAARDLAFLGEFTLAGRAAPTRVWTLSSDGS